MNAILAALLSWLLFTLAIHSQDESLPEAEHSAWDLYIQPNSAANSADVIFLNVLTGETHAISVNGERFTLLEDGLLFFDRDANQVQFIQPHSAARDHTFIALPTEAQRVDWTVSKDRGAIAWTITRTGSGGALSTRTYTAKADGRNTREILNDGPRDGLRVLPVAFTADNSSLIMDVHPDGIADILPYRQFAGLFALDLRDGSARPLSDESPCYCAAGFGDSLLLRFIESTSGPDLSIIHLNDEQQTRVAGPASDAFTIAGEPLLSDDESQAIYALSHAPPFASPDQNSRTVFMRVDLLAQEQTIVSHPIAGLARPIAWTEDSSAILFASDARPGTWKLRLSDGDITHIANAEYLGQLGR